MTGHLENLWPSMFALVAQATQPRRYRHHEENDSQTAQMVARERAKTSLCDSLADAISAASQMANSTRAFVNPSMVGPAQAAGCRFVTVSFLNEAITDAASSITIRLVIKTTASMTTSRKFPL